MRGQSDCNPPDVPTDRRRSFYIGHSQRQANSGSTKRLAYRTASAHVHRRYDRLVSASAGAQQIETEPADLVFLENNQAIATQIVRLSFDFGKAVAIETPEQGYTSGPPAADNETRYLMTAKAKLDANTQQAVVQLASLTQASLKARGADRKKLDGQIAKVRNRI